MMRGSWIDLSSHLAWLDEEGGRLLEFASGARSEPGGFAWLDEEGRPQLDRPVETWITARMTHVFALAHLRGIPGAGPLAEHGLAALGGPIRDAENGGWYSSLTPEGRPHETRKAAYVHAFVVLAAASGAAAELKGAVELLQDALSVVDRRFWSEAEGRSLESWDAAWKEPEAYRGANSNMHMVEAFLAAADVTGDERWRGRALSMAERLIHGAARENGWRLPEHFDARWRPMLEYNADAREDPFRPYGSTIGHWLEWSRLLLQLEASLSAPPAWLFEDASTLFDSAVRVGWAVDGAEGFVYTVDWNDRPVVRQRMHWVLAEAIAAAAAFRRRAGQPVYEEWYRAWWDHAAACFIDRRRGSWQHELGPDQRPAELVWSGKPDVYHAYQATLLPQLPLAPALAVALRDRL
jgi:mannose/cellobiose epimerase-like protein (N-acyl-D-glucosamine 2-epimerase family)